MLNIEFLCDDFVLRDLSLQVPMGEVSALMGRNGAGKTTLLRAIMGLSPISLGSMEFQGRQLHNEPPQKRAALGIGYVPQGKGLFADMSVADNIAIGLRARHPYHENDNVAILHDLWSFFPPLERLRNKPAATLSGGEQQMLAIARALALRPRLLLLDEPSEALQPSMVKTIADILNMLKGRGVAVLLVEQRSQLVQACADRLHFLSGGGIAETIYDRKQFTSRKLLQKHLGV